MSHYPIRVLSRPSAERPIDLLSEDLDDEVALWGFGEHGHVSGRIARNYKPIPPAAGGRCQLVADPGTYR